MLAWHILLRTLMKAIDLAALVFLLPLFPLPLVSCPLSQPETSYSSAPLCTMLVEP